MSVWSSTFIRGDDRGLFTHLHTVNVDPSWAAGDSQLLGSHPAAHTLALKATQGREESFHHSHFHLFSSLFSALSRVLLVLPLSF